MCIFKTTLALALGLTLTLSAQAGPTLERIRSTSIIHLGHRDASVPFSYLDEHANPTGFAWEISLKIAKAVQQELELQNLTIKHQSITSGNRTLLLNNGTIDIECGSTTNNSQRIQNAAFSVNYFYTGTRFIVPAKSTLETWDDLANKTVVSTVGTTNLQILRQYNADNSLNIRIATAKDHDAAFLSMKQGVAAAFAMDEVLLHGLRAASGKPENFKIVGKPIKVEPYACMVHKDDPEFLALVDKAIIDMMESGEFTKLYTKWFLSPITPMGINLELPMSDELSSNLAEHSNKPLY